MRCIFTQSFWNHLISNLCFCATHQFLMPLTYCGMSVNVNEKYIIHIPQSHLRVWLLCQTGCLTHAQRGKERQSTPTQFIISFIDFLVFGLGVDVCNYIVLQINFSSFQSKLCVASRRPDLDNHLFF